MWAPVSLHRLLAPALCMLRLRACCTSTKRAAKPRPSRTWLPLPQLNDVWVLSLTTLTWRELSPPRWCSKHCRRAHEDAWRQLQF